MRNLCDPVGGWGGKGGEARDTCSNAINFPERGGGDSIVEGGGKGEFIAATVFN